MDPLERRKTDEPSSAGDTAGALVPFPDQSSFQTLVERHYAPLYQFALHICRNAPDAKDVVQETFRRLATHGHQIRNLNAAKTWLYTVAYRSAMDHRRSVMRWLRGETKDTERVLPDELPVAAKDAAVSADTEAVQQALRTLPEKHRAPLSLFYLEDLSYEEISSILGVPIGTVMSRLHRGRLALAAALGVDLQRS